MMRRTKWIGCVVLAAVLAMIGLVSGCSMNHWGGEMAGTAPGFHYQGASLLSPAKVSFTSDGTIDTDGAEFTAPTATQPATFVVRKTTFDQRPSVNQERLPAILKELPAIQKVQVEYAKVWADAFATIADRVCSIFSPLLALNGTKDRSGLLIRIPNKFELGGRPIETIEDFRSVILQMQQEVEALKAMQPPTVDQPVAASP